MESGCGGRLLVLNGFLYRKKNKSLGKTYWLCCVTKCSARGILDSNGDFYMTHTKHTHKSNVEKLVRKRKLLELKKLALQGNTPGQQLLKKLNFYDDVKKNLNFIRTCRMRCRKKTLPSSAGSPPVFVGLDYKRLPSRFPSKELLFHSGYFFRQDSVNPNKKECKYWRCTVSKCKARAKTDGSGNLTLLKDTHNHENEDLQDASKDCQKKPRIGKGRRRSGSGTVDKNTVEPQTQEKSIGTEQKDTKKRKHVKVKSEKQDLVLVIEDASLGFSPPGTDSETFNFEKLMEETLADDYCPSPEFDESSLALLKSEPLDLTE